MSERGSGVRRHVLEESLDSSSARNAFRRIRHKDDAHVGKDGAPAIRKRFVGHFAVEAILPDACILLRRSQMNSFTSF